jgi:predicted alpha/beta hydrolase family esterase
MPLLETDARILTIPGLDNSGPVHWQSLWEHKFSNCERIELGDWANPDKDRWVRQIANHISGESAPILIAAHSLGCHAFSYWYANAPASDRAKIAGALLVAPPDLGKLSKLSRVTGFGQVASFTSSAPMIVVGSDNDPYAQTAHVWRLSRQWDARFENAGSFGHINAESQIGDWPYGQYLLASLHLLQTPALASDPTTASTSARQNRPRSRDQRYELQESFPRP